MLDVALSPKARALIQAHRNEHHPTAADRERVAAALRARLGSTTLPPHTPIPSRLMSFGHGRAATAFGLCVVGSVLFLARRPHTTGEIATRNKPPPAVLSATATVAPSEPSTSEETPISPQPKVAAIAPQRARSPGPTPDTLAQEVRLLSSATSQLSSGRAAGALLTLDEHQRRFSNGALSDERNAAKARALCMLHRFSEGQALLARLAPGTPLAARVKEACDSPSSGAEAPNLH